MTEPTYGITYEWRNTQVRPVVGGDFSGLALVGPAPNADNAAFPLNEPVALYSNNAETIAKLGAGGYLPDAIEGVADQLGELQRAAKICVVRTQHSTLEDPEDKLEAELTAILGSASQMTGMHALRGAASHIGWTPRLVDIPGHTHQTLGTDEANPVIAELPGLLDALFAVSVVEGPKTSVEDAITWREAMASKRLIPVVGGVKVRDGLSASVHRPLSSRVLGLMIRRDHEKDGLPFHSVAGQAISGIVAPGWDHAFSLTDGANQGQDLLAANIGIVERGEIGVDDAVADSGFRFIGTDHADTENEWQFYHQTRGNDWIWLSFLKTLRGYLGRYNLTIQAVQSAVNTMNRRLRDLEADEHLYKGSRILFDQSANSVDEIAAGKITFDPTYYIPPVWRRTHLRTSPNRAGLATFVQDVATALGQIAI